MEREINQIWVRKEELEIFCVDSPEEVLRDIENLLYLEYE